MSGALIALAVLAVLCLGVLWLSIANAKPEEELWPDGEEGDDGAERIVTGGKKSGRRE